MHQNVTVVPAEALCSDPVTVNHHLSRAYLGKSKGALDLVELEVELQQAVSLFGPFVKYVVTKGESSSSSVPVRNALDVLMSRQGKK